MQASSTLASVSLGGGYSQSADQQLLAVTTPRSLEAVRRLGLAPSDLVLVPYARFREREMKLVG
jgi:hypothetical protein